MPMVTADPSVVEEMLEMEEASEPGAEMVGKAVEGDDGPGSGTRTMVNAKGGAGWVTVYHTESGEPSNVNRNLLDFQLNKKLENGKRAFTTRKDKAPTPIRGKYRCGLHPDAREPWMDTGGLVTCRKANLTTPYQVRLHMMHRHKTAWETIEERKQAARDARQEAFQERLLSMAAGQAPQAATAAPEPTKKKGGEWTPERKAKFAEDMKARREAKGA